MGAECCKVSRKDEPRYFRHPTRRRSRQPALSQLMTISSSTNQLFYHQQHQIGYCFLPHFKQNETQIHMSMVEFIELLQFGEEELKRQNVSPPYNQTQQLDVCDKKKIRELLSYPIPQAIRWQLWYTLMHDQLFSAKITHVDKENERKISMDLKRTFPKEKFFIAEIGRTKLANLLLKIASIYPEVGYLQGMNQVLAFVLLVNGGDESQALSFYKALDKRDHISGFFVDGFPLNFFYQHVFIEELRKSDKQIYEFVKDLPSVVWIFKWFNTLFLYSFPMEFCIQVWDRMISIGMLFIVYVAVGLMLASKEKIMKMQDHDEFLFFLNGLQDGDDCYGKYSQIYENSIQLAQDMVVSRKTIEHYAKTFIKQVRKSKEDKFKENKITYATFFLKTKTLN